MNPPLHHISALASAIQSRLSEGGEVMITGVGLLRRVHEPASVETRDDGQKVLLPPKEAIQFTANKSLSEQFDEALVSSFSSSEQADIENPRDTIDEMIVKLRKELEETGELVLEDVGSFTSHKGKISFEPAEALIKLVNKPFAGLPPIAPREEVSEQVVVTKLIDEPADEVIEPVTVDTADVEVDSVAIVPVDDEDESVAVESADVDESEHTLAPTVLDQLANQSEGETGEVLSSDSVEDDSTIDEDIDALLDSVWAPVATASGDINYDRQSRITDMQEQAEISDSLDVSEEDVAVPVEAVVTGAGNTHSSAVKMSAERRAKDRNAEPKRRRGMGVMLVPALIVFCALAAIVLWPRISGGNDADSAIADSAEGADSNDASADPLYSTHAGGRADVDDSESEDLSTFESNQFLRDDDDSSVEAVPEPTAEQDQQAAAPPATQAPTPAPPSVAREEPASRQSGNELPSQLRGPGQITPAPGGATWILASGNRTSAEELAARYRSQGYRSSVLAGEANGIAVYRVAVGQFANANDARSLRSRLPADAPASTWVLNF